MIKCRMKNRGPSFVPNSRHARNSRAPLMRQFYTGVGNTEGRLRTRRWLVLDDDLWPRTLESETRPCLGTRGPRLSPEARAPFSFSSPFFFPPPLLLPPFSSLCSPTSPPPSPPLLPHHIFRLPLPLLFPSIPSVSVGLSIVISRDWPVSCRAKRSPMETRRWSLSGGQGDACFFHLPPLLFSLFFSSIYYRSTGHPPWGTRDERFLGVIRDSILGSAFKGRLEYFDRLRFRYG